MYGLIDIYRSRGIPLNELFVLQRCWWRFIIFLLINKLAILVYDASNPTSLILLDQWYKELMNNNTDRNGLLLLLSF